MGWSCDARAGRTMDRITARCLETTKIQNVWEVNGARFMWERSNVEHDDGRITGTVWRFLPNERVRRSGPFHIRADGSIQTFTNLPKAWREEATVPC